MLGRLPTIRPKSSPKKSRRNPVTFPHPSGEIYLLKLTILKTDGQLTTTVASRPYIQMKDGQSAEIMVGTHP